MYCDFFFFFFVLRAVLREPAKDSRLVARVKVLCVIWHSAEDK